MGLARQFHCVFELAEARSFLNALTPDIEMNVSSQFGWVGAHDGVDVLRRGI